MVSENAGKAALTPTCPAYSQASKTTPKDISRKACLLFRRFFKVQFLVKNIVSPRSHCREDGDFV
jgi:hypothetical protein